MLHVYPNATCRFSLRLGHARRKASIPSSGSQSVDTFPKSASYPANQSPYVAKEPSRALPWMGLACDCAFGAGFDVSLRHYQHRVMANGVPPLNHESREHRAVESFTSAQTATGCFRYLAMYSSSLTRSAANRRMPSASFSVAMGSSLSIHRNVFSFISTSGIS